MRSERAKIIIGFFIITLIWSSTWFAIKIGDQYIPPFFGVAFRFTFALILLSIVMLVRGEKLSIDRSNARLFAILGIFSFCIPFFLLYWAEETIPSGLASILFAVYPFVVAVVSHMMLPEEPMTSQKIAGICSAFAGIVIIFWSDVHSGRATIEGMVAVLLCTMLQGMVLVLVKKQAKHIPPVSLNVGGMIFGVPLMFALAFVFEKPSDIHFTMSAILAVCFLGMFGTVIAFVIYYWLLKRIEA
ncbi:MAG TPA: DMT family transporter, partial [Bacteroidota bacterium]|nr:DMT family transporter [Bacteroidota bacterium]